VLIKLAVDVVLAGSTVSQAEECTYRSRDGSTATISGTSVVVKGMDGTVIRCVSRSGEKSAPISLRCEGTTDELPMFFISRTLDRQADDILILMVEGWYPQGCKH